MTRDQKYRVTIWLDTEEEKEICQRWFWHLKYKTSNNFGKILYDALQKYNEVLK